MFIGSWQSHLCVLLQSHAGTFPPICRTISPKIIDRWRKHLSVRCPSSGEGNAATSSTHEIATQTKTATSSLRSSSMLGRWFRYWSYNTVLQSTSNFFLITDYTPTMALRSAVSTVAKRVALAAVSQVRLDTRYEHEWPHKEKGNDLCCHHVRKANQDNVNGTVVRDVPFLLVESSPGTDHDGLSLMVNCTLR
jgi:hypothetical protein